MFQFFFKFSTIFFIIFLSTEIFANNTTPSTSTTTSLPATWNDLLKQLNSTLIGVTSSNINARFRSMEEIAENACATINLSKTVNQFQIAVYVESAIANLTDGVKDNVRFYLTKVLNDVIACKS